MTSEFRRLLASACLVAVCAAAPHAAAQTAPDVVVTGARTADFEQVVGVGKTGTPIAEIPRSIQVIPRALADQQGAVRLTDVLRDVSGLSQGGQFAFGFYDRVISRGLNVTYLNDDLPDGTSDLGGITHTLTGVERVEVLKGPGSALFGGAEQGGAVNLVHYRPSDVFGAGASEQYGTFDTSTTDVFVTGPTGLKDVDYRIDGEYARSDGFRSQANRIGEILGDLSWRPSHHDVELRVEYHRFENTPDATGIPFSPPTGTGKPAAVDVENRYYTPYAFADQNLERIFLSDSWTVNDHLTVNLRSAYSRRDADILRNAGGMVRATGGLFALTGRQLRRQDDTIGDLNLQAEPTWRFDTGPVRHTLVTGFELRRIDADTERATADLPNIANILSPVVTDGPALRLAFTCDAGHSCDDADLTARFYGLYAVDQIDVTRALKVRLSAREDVFDTQVDARALLPVNGGQSRPCTPPAATACPLVPGQPVSREDSAVSYDVGAVYILAPQLSVFAGYSDAAYPIFNTEEPETVGQTPERGQQAEFGLRAHAGSWLSASSSLFRATRANVFNLLVQPNPAGPGNIDVVQVFSYRVEGWESDLDLRPVPAWNVIANLTVQAPRITRYPQAPVDIGHGVPSVPSVLANLFTTYDLGRIGPVSGLQLAFGVRYKNHEFADANETRLVPGVPLFDVALNLPVARYSLSVGLQNAFDRRNFLYGDGTGGGALPGPGRTAYLRLAVKL